MDRLTLEQYSEKIDIPVSELEGASRVPEIALARQAYWYYLKQHGIILIDIASMFNRKQHSTIISGINTIKDMIDTNNNTINRYLDAMGYNYEENTFSHQDISN
ncbi:MAG: helix-turn-helix domain-containing protein [Dysgonomonas sp.]